MANLTPQAATLVMDGTPIPATLYCQLHLDDPTVTGDQDISAGGSARKAFTRTGAVDGVASNVGLIQWIPYTANETLTHVSVWDDPSAGVCWFVGNLNNPIVASIDDSVYFIIGSLVLELEHY